MKKAEIVVGGMYAAKVSEKIVPVEVLAFNVMGYAARNLKTGRVIQIKTAARFRYPCNEEGHRK